MSLWNDCFGKYTKDEQRHLARTINRMCIEINNMMWEDSNKQPWYEPPMKTVNIDNELNLQNENEQRN